MKYKVYALTCQYQEYYRTIERKKELTDTQREEIGGRFADKIAWGKNTQVILYGCVPVTE